MDKHPTYGVKRLAENNEYYNNVFKKTERTVSVVFYVLSHIPRTDTTAFQLDVISDKAMKVHEAALATLSLYEYEAKAQIFPFKQSLVALEGALRIGNAARVMTDETLHLLLSEVDLVQRYLKNHFLLEEPIVVGEFSATAGAATLPARATANPRREASVPRARRVAIPPGDISTDAHLVYSQLVDRSTRIRTVLEAKPEATIKDIAEVITDVSEKTIQRELNSLIEKGQVIRQGERRWSKYSIAPKQ